MLDNIFLFIGDLVKNFNSYAKEYQFIAGAISLWGLGVVSYFGKNVPQKIWAWITKQTTTKLTLISTHESYHKFLKWLEINGYLKRVRTLKISNGQFGSENALRSIGYGDHYFIIGFRPFKLNMRQIDGSMSSMEKDEITVVLLGRSYKLFNKIFDEISTLEFAENKLSINKWRREYFTHVKGQRKRKINTVFLRKGIKEEIIGFVENFISNENWYVDNGINYHTGLLFYGPPGTGKTSFVKALASHFNKNLYILGTGRLYDIENAMLAMEENSILLIEDIDTESATNKRCLRPPSSNGITSEDDLENPLLNFSFSNMSDILNSIDGISTTHGRILIATTNHIDKLDDALLREGRFDLKIKFDYADEYTLKQFLNNYYPNFKFPDNFKIMEDINQSKIQNMINKKYSPEKIIELLEYKG